MWVEMLRSDFAWRVLVKKQSGLATVRNSVVVAHTAKQNCCIARFHSAT